MAKRVMTGFKAYEELEFTDDFMFGKVMEDLELCHDILECLLQRKIGKIIEADFQKEYKFTSDGKPIRMDLFTRTGDEVFDSEVQKLNKKSIEFLELPKRTRFYQSSIDADHMKKGYSYKRLPEATVLFICTFDPFSRDLGQYTFRERCVEDDGLFLGDGTTKIFYNCTYKGAGIPEDLRTLYEYLDSGMTGDALTERINEAVKKARSIEDWRSMYVKEMVLLMDAREEGREEGREEERKKTEAACKRAEAAEARVRELEAQLAAMSGTA